MTDGEIRRWLDGLAPTNAQRVKVVRELLWHANSDGMSAEDRTACRRALDLITDGDRRERNKNFDSVAVSA